MPKRVTDKRPRSRHFIREWRKHRGITQEQLAERIGTTKATISRIENGLQPYTQDFLDLCAEALMTEPGNLVVRNPRDPEGIWSLWDKAKPGERRQLVEVGKVIVGGTGTDG